jgi:hypothetical protein
MRIDARVQAATETTLRALQRLTFSGRGSSSEQIVTACSLAESLVDQLLDTLVAESTVGDTPLGRRLLQKNADAFHQSWEERHGWLSSGFGIEMAGTREGQRLNTVIAVRNAIIHGDGKLTDKQLKNPAAAIALRRNVRQVLDSDVQGRRIMLGVDAGRRSVLVASEYVLAVDAAISIRTPALFSCDEKHASTTLEKNYLA